MKQLLLTIFLLSAALTGFSQTEERIKFTSITASENTGQNYSSWLTDNVDSLVPQAWENNFKWVDVTLQLEKKANIGRLSLYDHEGVFTDKPAEIYALNGSQRTLLGSFEGPGYMNWVEMPLPQPVVAEAIVVHKYSNNIPQKIKAFGQPVPQLNYRSILGKIEAESFDAMHGVQTESTSDNGGGLNVAWIDDNDWMDYNVHVPATGVYTFKYRIANSYGNGKIEVQTTNGTVLSSIDVPQTGGWQGWTTISTTIPLSAGDQTLRIFAKAGAWNFNWFEVGGPVPLPGKIEAENYASASNVQAETTSDVSGNLNLGWIDDNDWMDYNVNVAETGTYTFNFRIANSYGNGRIEIRTANGTVLAGVDVPQTGGWQSWSTISTTATLQQGSQILRLHAVRGDWNFNWFEAVKTGSTTNPQPQLTQAVLSFNALPDKTVGDAEYALVATSNNTQTPITFTSSNAGIVTVSNATGSWKAKVIAAGTANIVASQAGNTQYLEAQAVTRTQVVHAAATTPNPPSSTVVLGSKITIDPKRWYQLNNVANGLEGLFDGVTNVDVNTGWGKALEKFDAYYPLLEGESMSIQGVKFFDGSGSMADKPMTLSVITDQWQRIPIATFTGEQYNGWVGPDPARQANGDDLFKLNTPITNARYLVITTWWGYPTEMELYGTHTPSTKPVTAVPQKNIKLEDMFGVNAFEWNFEDGRNPAVIDESFLQAMKSFTGIRHYMDWQKLEANEGKYTYNPTHSGGWNYDAIYERCKAEGIEVLACLKTLPDWLMATYPANERDSENVPVRYGKDFSDPASYLEQAKVGFQYMARYGSNTAVNPALLSVNGSQRWTGDGINTVKIGLNLIKYIECDNERDKWWKGRKGYQTAREYAANMSAFYDGHKNTMGPGVGVKNADPNVKVVMAGTALASTDYVRGMIDWCKEHRGYRADGSVNLCWDIINYHLYSDDANSSQSGQSSRGVAPEVGPATRIADEFTEVAHRYGQDMPVWITETGYDVHPGSPIKAIAIGNRSVLQTQADWILRTALLYARKKIEKVFFYQTYDDNAASPGQFASSGLLNPDQTRKPAADYLYQVNKVFGKYTYKQSLNSNPFVDRYELNGQSAYALYVPDETGRTATYTLDLGNVAQARIYTPKEGRNDMEVRIVNTVQGKVTLTVTETPIFVTASTGSSRLSTAEASVESGKTLHEAVEVYPNPTTDYIMVRLKNEKAADLEVNLFDANRGGIHKQLTIKKTAGSVAEKMDVSALPVGVYILEIKQGNERAFRKILKGN